MSPQVQFVMRRSVFTKPFAERLIELFLGGAPLGRAMREARLSLLAQRNPLGLVYTSHAYAGLALVNRGDAALLPAAER